MRKEAGPVAVISRRPVPDAKAACAVVEDASGFVADSANGCSPGADLWVLAEKRKASDNGGVDVIGGIRLLVDEGVAVKVSGRINC